MKRDLILGLIQKVLKAIDKTGSEEEKSIAHELVDKVIPTPIKYKKIFYVQGKDTYFKVSNKEVYKTTCQEKKADKYIGCAIVNGYYAYGSKIQFNKHLKDFYGCNEKTIEQYALIDAYQRFGGKENFEKFVDDRFRPKAKKETK